MSKRKSSPALPSMDDLLGGQTSPATQKNTQAPKSLGSQEPEKRIKVTYYFPPELVARIDEAHFELSKATRGTNLKIHKYDMARVAWELLLAEYDADPNNNPLTNTLLP